MQIKDVELLLPTYLVIERVRELASAGHDVTVGDKENITLLHWAAINNRVEVANFLLAQGADINCLGGQMCSTPLHWAAKQNHSHMVVMLVGKGARLDLEDKDGCQAIHVAASAGCTPVVGYLIAVGQGVDTLDRNGRTPLMWASYKSYNFNTARLLIKLGASITIMDYTHRNTALHWAITGERTDMVNCLVHLGKQSTQLSTTNKEGKTPFDLLRTEKGHVFRSLAHGVKGEIIKGSKLNNTKKSALKELLMNSKFREAVMVSTPFFVIWAIGSILESSFGYLFKCFLFFLVSVSINAVVLTAFDERLMNFAPVGIYLGFKLWMYYTWLTYVSHYVSYANTVSSDMMDIFISFVFFCFLIFLLPLFLLLRHLLHFLLRNILWYILY